jgi:phenylacetate-CoA ligase
MITILGRAAYAMATTVLGERKVFQYLREARRVHSLSAEDITSRQHERLGAFLNWVGANNGYYRTFIQSSSKNADPLDSLRQLPILEKRTLQDRPSSLLTATFSGRTVGKSTGGSTGAPIRIIKDADGVAREMATTWAALEWYGIRLGERSVRFWGTPLTRRRRLRFKLTDLAMNRIRLSAFDLDDTDLRRYWTDCFEFRPVWMYGYASLIHMFADWIERNGLDGQDIGLRAVVSTSEPLNDTQRDQISRVFDAPVYDEYGCGEVGAIAYSCEVGRLHIMTDNVFVEVLDDNQLPVTPGQTGEVIVTDLTNRAMPLLRYRLGDRAVVGSQCSCGRGFPTIGKILGRIHDVVYTPTGRRWHGEKVDYLMSQLFAEQRGFRQYQVIQYSRDALRICLVSENDIPDDLKRRIESYVSENLDGMKADVIRVDHIERAPSGKIRLVRNDWLPAAAQPH